MNDHERTAPTRRRFLHLGAAGAAALAGCARIGLGPAKRRIPIAVQLYSVRGECARDLPGSLAKIAAMGYEGVEFAGYYGRSAEDLRKLLDAHGLRCAGAHVGLQTLLGDELAKSIDFHRTLGNRFLIVPGLPPQRRKDARAWLETAKLFNGIAAKLEPHGMRTGYHNHSVEFKPMGGQAPWDIFFGNTVPSVVMQLDTGNAMHGGAESVPILRRYPGRAATIHCKPFSKADPKAAIGEDELPWPEILRLCRTIGGTEWLIVEYEVGGVPPFDAIERCLDGLKRLGA